jgi:hypothetical protein
MGGPAQPLDPSKGGRGPPLHPFGGGHLTPFIFLIFF